MSWAKLGEALPQGVAAASGMIMTVCMVMSRDDVHAMLMMFEVQLRGIPHTAWQTIDFPCLVVNVGSGVSVLKVESDGQYSRVSGSR